MLTNNIAQRLDSGDPDWKKLKQHIESHIDSLDTLDGIDFSDKEKSAILGQARADAKRILVAILEPFGKAEESTEDPTVHISKKTGVV